MNVPFTVVAAERVMPAHVDTTSPARIVTVSPLAGTPTGFQVEAVFQSPPPVPFETLSDAGRIVPPIAKPFDPDEAE
jgi:hypothetical protein